MTQRQPTIRLVEDDGDARLVMLDVNMAGLNGFEVCTILRTQAGPLLCLDLAATGMSRGSSARRLTASRSAGCRCVS